MGIHQTNLDKFQALELNSFSGYSSWIRATVARLRLGSRYRTQLHISDTKRRNLAAWNPPRTMLGKQSIHNSIVSLIEGIRTFSFFCNGSGEALADRVVDKVRARYAKTESGNTHRHLDFY